MTVQELLLLEFEDEIAGTRRMLERVPEASLSWKPHDKSMTLGRLASHVADLPNRCTVIIGMDVFVRPANAVPFLAGSTKELVEHFDAASTEARRALTGLTDDQLAGTWALKFGDRVMVTLPRGRALRKVFMNHLIHHRGQLSVYLRLLDVPVPGMYGPSADDAAQAR